MYSCPPHYQHNRQLWLVTVRSETLTFSLLFLILFVSYTVLPNPYLKPNSDCAHIAVERPLRLFVS